MMVQIPLVVVSLWVYLLGRVLLSHLLGNATLRIPREM